MRFERKVIFFTFVCDFYYYYYYYYYYYLLILTVNCENCEKLPLYFTTITCLFLGLDNHHHQLHRHVRLRSLNII